jgi:hypothetical protein
MTKPHTNRRGINVGSEVLTAVVMKSSKFWDIKPDNPLKMKEKSA